MTKASIRGELCAPPSLINPHVVVLVENYPAEPAYQFCLSLLEKQIQIDCVFLYGEGVLNTSSSSWQNLAKEHVLPLYACAKSAEQRALPCQHIEIAGLATFMAKALQADEVHQFKAASS
ncbi:MAG: DsrE family protein [Gammaproteobacteria bacterium]|nr:DsrE family protein [Gammaproteobacteria bacterium]